jgi:hypothetical protein
LITWHVHGAGGALLAVSWEETRKGVPANPRIFLRIEKAANYGDFTLHDSSQIAVISIFNDPKKSGLTCSKTKIRSVSQFFAVPNASE